MVPEVLGYDVFVKMASVIEARTYAQKIPLGIDFEFAQSVSLNVKKENTLILADTTDKIVGTLHVILAEIGCKKRKDVIIIDTPQGKLEKISEKIGAQYIQEDSIEAYIDQLHDEVIARQKLNSFIKQPQYIVCYHPKYIFDKMGAQQQEKLVELYQISQKQQIHLIIAGEYVVISGSYGAAKKQLDMITQVIIQMKASDQSLVQIGVKMYGEPMMKKDEAYILENGVPTKIKIPEME
jgi:S-DNA-T family DNA segregation ATPase FtsK/SpoIIIE